MRRLSPSEARIIVDGVKAMFAITTVRGAVDPLRLQRAFDLLLREQPRLGATIEHDDDGYVLRDTPTSAPSVDVSAATLDTEINTPLDRTRTLVRLVIVPDGEGATVVFAIDHPIGDGRFLVAMNDRLWALYAEGHRGTARPIGALAPAMETRLAGRFDEDDMANLVARIAAAPPSAVLPTRLDPHEDALRLDAVLLDIATTDAFFAVARAHKVSIHSLVCGVLMTVLRTRFDPAGAPHRITCDSPVDLRARLDPPLPADVAGLCVGFATASLLTTGAEDATELARAFQTQMDAARAANFPEKFLMASAKLPSSVHSGTTMLVSNLGPLTIPPLPDDLEFIDLQILARSTASPPFFVVATLRGRLRLTLVYTQAHHNTDRMRELMADVDMALEQTARLMTFRS